jgi:prepilin-type N-terminal cleavage/methylation domain-containing protein
MAGAHHPSTASTPPARRSRQREHAFSLLELVVVMLIVGVLIVGLVSALRSGRTSSGRVAAIAAARSIGDAVEDFRKDHSGRPPVLGSAGDWPQPLAAGPRSTYDRERYMRRGAPDPLTAGHAELVAGPGTGSGNARWLLQYTASGGGAARWSITVRDRTGVSPPCSIGGGTIATLPERPC